MGVCRRCLCKSEENEDRSPKGANMAGAIFGGILVLESVTGKNIIGKMCKIKWVGKALRGRGKCDEPHLVDGCLKYGMFFGGERCFFWGEERAFFEGEESPAGGANMAGALGG